MKNRDFAKLLQEYFIEVERCLSQLSYSYEQVKKIDLRADQHTAEELERLEAYTARFSRLSDIFSQKFLRTILVLLREDQSAFIDRANKLEKLEVIPSSEALIAMKDLRNSIVHDYWVAEVQVNTEKSIAFGDDLMKAVETAVDYCVKRDWLSRE